MREGGEREWRRVREEKGSGREGRGSGGVEGGSECEEGGEGGVVEEGEGKKRIIPLTTHRVHTSHPLSQ